MIGDEGYILCPTECGYQARGTNVQIVTDEEGGSSFKRFCTNFFFKTSKDSLPSGLQCDTLGGNLCFFYSVLQCILNSSNISQKMPNEESKPVTKQLALIFQRFDSKDRGSPFDVSDLRDALAADSTGIPLIIVRYKQPQTDAYEFFSSLVNCIHQEIREAGQSPFKPDILERKPDLKHPDKRSEAMAQMKKEFLGKSGDSIQALVTNPEARRILQEVADISWYDHLEREQSILRYQYEIQTMSIIYCPCCKKGRYISEMMISLPVNLPSWSNTEQMGDIDLQEHITKIFVRTNTFDDLDCTLCHKRAARDEDGAARNEDGAARDEDDAAHNEDGSARNEGDAARNKDGAARNEDGAARDEDGAAHDENGSLRNEDGSARNEDGAARNEDGAARDEDGAARDEDGSARDEDGATRDEGGADHDEDGSARNEGDAACDEDGAARDEGGAARDEDGSACDEDGAARDEDGAASDEGGKRGGPLEKIMLLGNRPCCIVVHLLRFQYTDNGNVMKNMVPVNVPLTLDLSQSEISLANKGVSTKEEYELSGVVIHYGSNRAGHYIAFIKKSIAINKEPEWYKMDDSEASEINIKEQLGKRHIKHNAYLLYYTKSSESPC